MAEVIDLVTKTKTVSRTLNNPASVKLLASMNENADRFQDLVVLYINEDGTYGMLETTPTLADKAVFIQMLQHQITAWMDRYHVPVSSTALPSDLDPDL